MKRATESTEASEALARTQKSFIQNSAARIIDSQTGQVNARKLADLIKQNPQTLREVGLLDDVSNISQQVRLANILQKTAKQGQAFAQQRSIAGQIIDEGKKGGLRNVVDNAFNSKYQAEAFRDLNNVVKRAKNPQAVEGLQHEIFDVLLSKATIKGGDLDGLISGKQLEDLLNSKVGEKTLRQNLLSSKLITPNQMNEVIRVARMAKIFEDSVRDPAKLDDIMKTGDGLLNLFARVVGSKVGANSFVGQMMGGTTLIAQSAFSKIAQKTIEKVPALKVQGVLTKAMQDPKFMAMLLEMGPKSPVQKQRRINAYLLQAGLLQD
jgi:CheY-like chemotaxis protein